MRTDGRTDRHYLKVLFFSPDQEYIYMSIPISIISQISPPFWPKLVYLFFPFLEIGIKTCFTPKCWYLRICGQNIIIVIILIFLIYGQKTIFTKWSQNNIIFFIILVFTDLWTKNYSKSYLKITSFSSKCWYFRINGQKTIVKSDLKKTSFYSKCCYLRRCGKQRFFKVFSK